jgi:hypothetical protein
MIGMIKPLVKRQEWYRAGAVLAVFTLGAVSSGFAVGLVVWLLSLAAQPLPHGADHVAASVILLGLAVADLGHFGLRTPSVNRQTRSYWWRSFGVIGGWFAWGLDLGTGITTLRSTSLFWGSLALAFVQVPPARALTIIPLYGLGLGLSLSMATLALPRFDLQTRFGMALLRSQPRIRVLSGCFLLFAAAAVWLVK